MKLLNVPPIKVGQYARYAVGDEWYIWKCTSIRSVPARFADPSPWDVKGVIVVSSWAGFEAGRTIEGYWCKKDRLLTEEETNEIIECTTV